MVTEEETKKAIIEEVHDGNEDEFDEEEFDEYVEKYEDKFGDYGEGTVLYSVAKDVYNVEVDSEFTSDSTGEGLGKVLIEDLEDEVTPINMDVEENVGDSFTLEVLLIAVWTDRSEQSNNIQKKFVGMDENGDTVLLLSSGEDAVVNFNDAGVNEGDFVRIEGASLLPPREDSDEDDNGLVLVGNYCEIDDINDSPPFDLDNVGIDFVNGTVHPDDFVNMVGRITDDPSVNSWEGCVCGNSYDTDTKSACPICGSSETTTFEMETYVIKPNAENVSPQRVQLPVGETIDVDDYFMTEVEVFGQYTIESGEDDEEYKKISAKRVEVLDEGNIGIPSDDSEEDENDGDSEADVSSISDEEDADSEDETQEDEEDELGDFEDEVEEYMDDMEEESEEDDSDAEENGEFEYEDALEQICENVKDFGDELPVQFIDNKLEQDHNITEEDERISVLTRMDDFNFSYLDNGDKEKIDIEELPEVYEQEELDDIFVIP